jgi:hypothetical protein
MLSQLLANAQKAGEIREEFDSELLAVMVIGFMREICLNWRLDKYNFSYRERTKVSLETFLEAYQKRKPIE